MACSVQVVAARAPLPLPSAPLQLRISSRPTTTRCTNNRAAAQSASREPQQQAASPSGPQRAVARSGPQQPPLPEPAAHQQTLRRSFVVGGIGLHTGEYAHIRVRPAFAGEGRYFVRVPPGTVSPLWQVEQPRPLQLEEVGGRQAEANADDQERNAQLFFSFIEGQETGAFSGTFEEYLQQLGAVAAPENLLINADAALRPEEEPIAGQPGEGRLLAHADSLQQGQHCCSVLGHGDDAVWGAEHLLAALECCGVDNARIELEGGREIPIIDGSALGWATEVQRAGMRPAPGAAGAEGAAARNAPAPQQVVTVRDGESFITYYPGPTSRVTVGVDCSAEAPVIGCQWFTWSPEGSEHFRWALAPARTFFASAEAVQALIRDGQLQGGPDYVSIIGDGDDWLDTTLVRFPDDEAARHSVVDLLGVLSLLARRGGRGLPAGHVVAYQPTHSLHAAFVRELLHATQTMS